MKCPRCNGTGLRNRNVSEEPRDVDPPRPDRNEDPDKWRPNPSDEPDHPRFERPLYDDGECPRCGGSGEVADTEFGYEKELPGDRVRDDG